MAMINYTNKVALNTNSGVADINKCNAIDMNEIKNAFNIQVAQGWYNIGVTATLNLTYVSFNSTTKIGVIASNLDLTPYLSVGMKFKFTQNSAVKYGIITAISSTQITLFMGNNFTLNNSGISNPFYSMLKAPYDFPINPDVWTLTTLLTQQEFSSNLADWTSLTQTITVPTGCWDVYLQGEFVASGTPPKSYNIQVALSTVPNSTPNTQYNLRYVLSAASTYVGIGVEAVLKSYLSTTQTTMYISLKTTNVANLNAFQSNQSTNFVKLVCAYI